MDLLSTIRKEGSRGGVDFKWTDVSTSQHRENYLGHSLMAPVGRWQKGRDLNWYAKADSSVNVLNKEETADERKARERKEEIRRVKEAEEDALARALGLPVPERRIVGTGANGIDVGEMRRVIKETEVGDDEIEEVGRARGFGDFVGKVGVEQADKDTGLEIDTTQGGLLGMDGGPRKGPEQRNRSRSRSRSRERRHRHHRHRSRSRDARDKHRHKEDHRRREKRGPIDRSRSRSLERRDRRRRSRSHERQRDRRERREISQSPGRERRKKRERSRSPWTEERMYPRRDDRTRNNSDPRPRRSRSPDRRDRERRRDGDRDRRR